jgi:hypothetical protein
MKVSAMVEAVEVEAAQISDHPHFLPILFVVARV